jgi:hypothetical protein
MGVGKVLKVKLFRNCTLHPFFDDKLLVIDIDD